MYCKEGGTKKWFYCIEFVFCREWLHYVSLVLFYYPDCVHLCLSYMACQGHIPMQDGQVSMDLVPVKYSVTLACLLTCLFGTEPAALTTQITRNDHYLTALISLATVIWVKEWCLTQKCTIQMPSQGCSELEIRKVVIFLGW